MRKPVRPEMTVVLPDFAVYQQTYRVVATVPTSREPVTITSRLVQMKDPFTMWQWKEDDLTGKRGGHTLRRGSEAWHHLNTASAFLHRDAIKAARSAGWIVDPMSGLWEAPLCVWQQALATIM